MTDQNNYSFFYAAWQMCLKLATDKQNETLHVISGKKNVSGIWLQAPHCEIKPYGNN